MKGKKILALSLAVLLLTALLPTAAFAAGSPGLAQGTSVLSKGANTSGAATVYYGGKPWRVIAYGSGSITLLAAENFGLTVYHSGGNDSNAYGTSTLKTAIEAIAAGFSSREQSAVIPRTLMGGSANYGVTEGESVYHDDQISGDPVENALLWPLSVAEANSLYSELRKADPANLTYSSYWWLRSPGRYGRYAAYVQGTGDVDGGGHDVLLEFGVRPAFYVNPESVLFTSAAVGGKFTSAVGARALKAVGAVDTAAWTLTLLDPSRSGFGIDPFAVTYNSETNAVTVPYSGARTGSNEYISAIIKDSSGNITYYGRVAWLRTAAAASGSITVNLAGKLNAGDTLFIFNEQVNTPPPETAVPVGAPAPTDTQTDYASALIEIEIPPKGQYDDGEAVLSLTVNAAPEEPDIPKTELDIPKTGDDEPLFLWLVLMSIGAIGMAAVVFFDRKHIIQKRDHGYSVLNLVAIGEKGEEKRPYTDADLHTENVHYEKY